MYLRFFLFFLPLLLCAILSHAQTVQVVDEDNGEPIKDVYIYTNEKDRAVTTNASGEADISRLKGADQILFQHASYEQLVFSFEELETMEFNVRMRSRSIALGEIFISASKREQDETEITQKITQIDRQEIGFSNPQTSADLLQSSGKVFVQKSQMGGGSPMIRGFAANSVMIAVDGVRMNNAIFRSGNLQNVISIDANMLENTEVIFGPGSIIYGSDALGGVMNFQTKEPDLALSDEEKIVSSDNLVRYSTANNERTVHADASLGYEKWGFLSSVTYSNFDDLRSGGNFYDDYPDFGKREEYVIRENGTDTVVDNDDVTLQRFSGYEQLNLMQKIRFRPNPDWNMSYGFHYATSSDIPRYDRLIERENGDAGQLVNAEWYYGPQIWMMNALQIEHFAESSLYDRVSGTFSYQWFQESRNDRKFQDPTLRNREENVDVFTGSLDFDKLWDDDKELFYGVEAIYNYVQSDAVARNIETGNSQPVPTRYPDRGSDYTQLATYVKFQHDLTDAFTLVSGLRYSHVMLDAQFGPDRFVEVDDVEVDEITFNTAALSGSLGFTWRPMQNWQFNLNGSTGFRAPNVDDAAKVFDSEPGTVVVPNSNLKPEYAYNLDFAIIKRFDEAARFELNTFYTWLQDAMVRRDFGDEFGQDSLMYDGTLSNVEAIVNAGKAYIYGASASLDVNMSSNFSLGSSLTYTDGKDIVNNEPLRHVAPLFGRIELVFEDSDLRVELYSEFNGEKHISDFSPSERSKTHLYTEDGTPAWATLNVKTSYRFNDLFQLNVGVENIFDKHYRPYSSGISAAGRNFLITLRATI